MTAKITKPLTFDEFDVGAKFESRSRRIEDDQIKTFARLAGDFNPLHLNQEYGEKSAFRSRVAHGHLVASIGSGLWSQLVSGTVIALLESAYRYVKPVRIGDEIRTRVEVTEKRASRKYPGGIIRLKLTVLNQLDKTVIEGTVTLLVSKERAPDHVLESSKAEASLKAEPDLWAMYQESMRLLMTPLYSQAQSIQRQMIKAADQSSQLYLNGLNFGLMCHAAMVNGFTKWKQYV